MQRPIRKSITTLLFSLVLCLPSLVLADHLHEVYNDEVNCELCSFSSPAATSNEPPQNVERSDQLQEAEKSTRLPFNVFRLNQYQRGPPLLR